MGAGWGLQVAENNKGNMDLKWKTIVEVARAVNLHTGGRGVGGHRQFCLPKMAHVDLSRAPEVHRK